MGYSRVLPAGRRQRPGGRGGVRGFPGPKSGTWGTRPPATFEDFGRPPSDFDCVGQKQVYNLAMSQTAIAIASIVAIVVGPIAALAIQRWADHRREMRKGKLWVFRTLMMYRATRLNLNFVQALNVIDVVFNADSQEEKEVRTAWKVLLDHLTTDQGTVPARQKAFDLTITLLVRMGKSLSYDFDEVYLKRQVYQPIGHTQVEEEQNEIRALLLRLLKGQGRLPVAV